MKLFLKISCVLLFLIAADVNGFTIIDRFQDGKTTSELQELPKRHDEIVTTNDDIKLLLVDAYHLRQKELYSEAIDVLLKAVSLLKEENNDLDLAYSYNEIGELYGLLNDEKSELDYYSLSEFIYKKSDKVTLTKIFNLTNLANIYTVRTRFPKALQRLTTAQEYALRFPDKRALAQVYTMMAQVYSVQKDAENTMKYMEEVQKILESGEVFSAYNVASNHLNMVLIYLKFDKIEKAEDLLKTIDVNADDYAHLVRMNYNWAAIFAKKEQYDKALSYIEKIKEILRDEPSIYNIAVTILEANINIKKGEHTNAISILENVLDDAIRFERLDYQKDIFSLLGEAYEETGNYKKSNVALREYVKINDSINILKIGKENDFLKTNFDVEKATFALEKKEEELAYLAEKNRLRTIYNTVLVICFVLLLILLVIVFKKQRKLLQSERKTQLLEKEALRQKIDFKNKQVIDFSLHIKEKNKLLEKIKKKIFKVYKQEDQKNKPLLSNVLNSINEDIRTNKTQIELYAKVQGHNEDFLEKISQSYPDLTSKEKEIIQMLRLDLSSKQIATRLNLSINSVDTYRSKIRNKIKVPKKQKLSEYIKKM